MILEEKNKIYLSLKEIYTTIIFELKRQYKIFLGFTITSILFAFLLSIVPYTLIPDYPLPETQADYFREGLQFFTIIVTVAACLFFGNLICSEYSNKTGYILFPIIKKQKLFIGKFIACLIYIYLIIGVFYLILGLAGLTFYGELIDLYYISLGIALFWTISMCCFITFLSSFMKNTTLTIITSITFLLIGDRIIGLLLSLIAPEFEPFYSLNYASNILIYIFEDDFLLGTMIRYHEQFRMGYETITWITPTIEAGLIIIISYIGLSLILAFFFIKRRQL